MATLKEFFEFVQLLKSLFQFWQKNREEDWFKKSHEVFQTLERATTPEEKTHAAGALVDLIRGL